MKSKTSKKKVDFSVRPRTAKEELPTTPDQWVREGQGAEAGPHKRLTLNLPTDLHTAFKARCVVNGITIQDKVQQLIERDLAADRQTSEVKPATP
jgi:hypothetical protein